MRVAVGGTFQPLHDGHKMLLRKAYELSKNVDVGLTSDEMARSMRTRPVKNYEEREKALREWVKKEIGVEPSIFEINDPYGPTLNEDYDCIVVSAETFPTAIKINQMRVDRGKSPLTIYRIECVLAEDGRPISATRVVKGEIDVHGRLVRHREVS
jgi:pantetheine-phosphate adenylyltransferase